MEPVEVAKLNTFSFMCFVPPICNFGFLRCDCGPSPLCDHPNWMECRILCPAAQLHSKMSKKSCPLFWGTAPCCAVQYSLVLLWKTTEELGVFSNPIRRASGEGARNGWRVPQGQQPKEIWPTFFSVEKNRQPYILGRIAANLQLQKAQPRTKVKRGEALFVGRNDRKPFVSCNARTMSVRYNARLR